MTIQHRHRVASRFWIAAFRCLILAAIPAPASVAQAQDAGKVLQLPAADRQEIERLLGKGVIGDALPAKPLPPAEAYMIGMRGRIPYLIRDEKGRTKNEAHEFAKTAGATPESWDYRIGKDRRAVFTKTADGGLIRHLKAEPTYIPEEKGEIRVPKLIGEWKLVPKGDSTEVTYQVHTEPGGSVPAMVANKFVVDAPFNTLKGLRERAEKN